MDDRIISLLRKKREGFSFQKLLRELGLSSKDRGQLRKRLKILEGKGVLRRFRSRYFFPEKSNLVRGKFISSFRGYGFVCPEGENGEDVYIPARYTGGALHGDSVEVFIKESRKHGKTEGKVIRLIKKGKKRMVGIYTESFGQSFFLPFDLPQAREIPLPSKGSFTPLSGMVVEVDRESRQLTEVYGMPDEPGVDTRVIIQRYNLKHSFSKEALDEARDIPAKILPEDMAGRMDYRHWKTVTIDGENAQDFDDAVSVKKLGGGHFLLGVHIADVSHYIKPESYLDKEAFQRGTSVYFPELTLPMLPEILSNNVCSLRPREERLTFSVLLEIDEKGEVVEREFHPSVIQTEERLTYDSVYKIFEGDEEENQNYSELISDLSLMRELARILRRKRGAEGSLDFDFIEPELVYREGKLQSVEPFETNEAHQLIEEFMVIANEAVASYLSERGFPLIYRIHPRPASQDLDDLRAMLAHFNISLPPSKKLESRDLQQALKLAEGKPEEKFINLQVLKSLKIAVYSEENQGHYGLAKKDYAHFTSPIRRYPDLVVHRILKKAISGEKKGIPKLTSIALHSTNQEREAEAAERDLVEWRIFRLLKEKVGDEFSGVIVGISKAGLIVELDDYFVDGVVPYLSLKSDFYLRKSEMTLAGKRTGKKYELGESVEVILASVNPILKRMTFILSSEER